MRSGLMRTFLEISQSLITQSDRIGPNRTGLMAQSYCSPYIFFWNVDFLKIEKQVQLESCLQHIEILNQNFCFVVELVELVGNMDTP